ncbi:MAG TPA: penicillin-binding transpeptidase domain-containing protein, partial [Peptostreptococcaceae bacterium]|nr:penicillin-binding transpeptidase domain-containing protein [Peptostreptococcaceae bacterium]
IISTGCQKQTAYDAFESYGDKWEKKDYEGMYTMLSSNAKERINKDEFISRHTNIYNGIEAENIDIKIKSEDKDKSNITFSISMNTLAGNVEISDYNVAMTKEKVEGNNQWTIDWNESMIFPSMDQDDKVSVERFNAKRGEIYDRNGKGLAINDTVITLGIHPSKFEQNKESNISQMANILDIKESSIEDKLNKNNDPEAFVPIVKILPNEKNKIAQVMEIEGVVHTKSEGRVYPGGEAFGSLIGYIRPINAEELEKHKGQGYSSTSMLGITGLEQEYEKRLREYKGGLIYISKQEDGKEVEKIEISKKQPKNGENIKLSIDFDLQKKIYEEMNKDLGASTALNPKNGEILAMVSSPSFDSNLYSTYIPESQKRAWKDNSNKEFENRFNNVYSPGSTFKLITAAVGLENGIIDPNEYIDIKGDRWQPNTSWGEYKVTRVSDTKRPVNLNDAFIYSDNIYFAMKALEIGKTDFIKEASKFGFNEKLPIDYTIEKSRLSNDNNIKDDMLLADTGYVQGQVLMSPLHVTLAYSSIVNDGNIMTPILELKENNDYKVWKKNVVSKENAKILLNSLTQVIENKEGTGHDAKINNLRLAGKTGTSELKKGLGDKEGKEDGWFVCMDTDKSEIVVSMIINDVKNRGGSHYVVPKVKNIMNYNLNK